MKPPAQRLQHAACPAARQDEGGEAAAPATICGRQLPTVPCANLQDSVLLRYSGASVLAANSPGRPASFALPSQQLAPSTVRALTARCERPRPAAYVRLDR